MATDAETIALRKQNAKIKADRRRELIRNGLGRADEGNVPRDAGGMPKPKPRPTARAPRPKLKDYIAAERAKSTASSADISDEEDTEEDSGGHSVPRPTVPGSLRAAATERRRDKPTNYKLHVITALSLAMTVRIMSQGLKAVVGYNK